MTRLVVCVGLLSLLLVLGLSAGASAVSEIFLTTQLTSNGADDSNHRISGNRIVWDRSDSTNIEIFTWTPAGGIVQLTSNSYHDSGPQVFGDRVVWSGYDGPASEIFTWTPAGGTVRLTANDYPDGPAEVSDDRVVWCGLDGPSFRDIFTWTPGGGTVQLTNGNFVDGPPDTSGDRLVWLGGIGDNWGIFTWTPADGTVQLTSSDIGDQNPQVSGDRAVWMCPGTTGNYSGFEIFTWTSSDGTVQLTANDYLDEYPQVSGNRVVWGGFDGNDRDVFAWTPSDGVTQLTSNNRNEDMPRVSGDRVVWSGYDGHDWEIFAWSPTDGTVQLTSNDRDDADPYVSGERVVWRGYDGHDWEIFTAVAVPTIAGFSDVPITHAYSAAIEAMAEAGIVSGFRDGAFHPDDPVTRQQFAKMIVKTLDLPMTGEEPCPFTDVGRNLDPGDPNYPRAYVAVCNLHGITHGKTATTFAPYANITQAQLLTMVVRGAAPLDILEDPGPTYYEGTNEGTHRLRTWIDADHALNGQIAEFNGLLEGIIPDESSNVAWNPYAKASRGEVAQILWRLLQKMWSAPAGS